MGTRLQVDRDERSVTVSLTRGEKRNALDLTTSHELETTLREHRATALPLVLRSSTPGMFVAGTDVGSIRERTVEDSLERVNARLFQMVEDHPWPTIAVIDGFALGGGCELAMACDLRISTPSATWGLPEVRLGILPSAGGLSRLGRLVGASHARDLVLTGRRIDGREAHRLGLVQRLAEPEALDQAVDTVLDDLNAASMFAVRLAKEAMRVDGDRNRLVDAAAQALCLASDEAQERMTAMLERRAGRSDR